jgi:microcin C transport system substrate-binding protein
MRRPMMRSPLGLVLALALATAAVGAAAAAGSHGLSLFGELKYGPEFDHFEYANPDAPKGGSVRYSAIGTYDTLNPYVIKGVPAAGIGMTFSSLMSASEEASRLPASG